MNKVVHTDAAKQAALAKWSKGSKLTVAEQTYLRRRQDRKGVRRGS